MQRICNEYVTCVEEVARQRQTDEQVIALINLILLSICNEDEKRDRDKEVDRLAREERCHHITEYLHFCRTGQEQETSSVSTC